MKGVGELALSSWKDLIKESFERCFYIPNDAQEDERFVIKREFVNKRGIYKDVLDCRSTPWAEYQLRPNQCVAMAVAPDLFTQEHAVSALDRVEQCLINKAAMGMRTLDPDDWSFRGNYVNSDQTSKETANGWNYHQGPPWLWPVGYYLRARLIHDPELNKASKERRNEFVLKFLSPYRKHLVVDPYCGLPELVAHDGGVCRDSCVVQAWSSATLIDAVADV
jgi:glycogen debranching enzyme